MLFFALLLASSLHGQCTQATDPIALFSAIELNDSEHPTRNVNNHVGLALNAAEFAQIQYL